MKKIICIFLVTFVFTLSCKTIVTIEKPPEQPVLVNNVELIKYSMKLEDYVRYLFNVIEQNHYLKFTKRR